MTHELQLVRTADFNNIQFDCYQDSGHEFWGTREQIGQLLEYENPRESIKTIHSRNRERLDKFSFRYQIDTPAGTRETVVYSFKGLLEICRYSNQPKANAVMDFLWEVADEIRKTGRYEVKKSPTPRIGRGIISAAKEILKSAGIKGNQFTLALDKLYKHYTGESALAAMGVELEAPEPKQVFTPTEIGKTLGISARRVNEILAGAGYQHKICDKWEALGKGVKYSVMFDTGKSHSDGTPVRQLKWKSEIIDIIKSLAD